MDAAPVDVRDALDLPREMRDRRAREDLRRAGDPAEPRRQVERAAAITTLDGHRLPRVQPDPDREGQRRIRDGLVDEPPLELDRRADRLPRRVEDRERLVAAELDDGAAAGLDAFRARPSANLPASAAAASSPCSCVKTVYPRTSAIRNVRMWASSAARPLATSLIDHGRLWPTPQDPFLGTAMGSRMSGRA